MPVTSTRTDADALTMTLDAEFPVTVERLWNAFTDPRQLERFWGPPGYPATFTEFDLRVGGRARYHMTSPEGTLFPAAWEFTGIDAPHSLEVLDMFVDEDGTIDASMPAIRTTMSFAASASGATVTVLSRFDSDAALEQAVAMGMQQGYEEGFAQLDTVLADLRDYALGKGTVTTILDDVHVKITRAFEAPRHLLWRAHTEPELMKRWLLGPDGWEMTVCETDLTPGGAYRNAWAPVGDTAGEPFGFEGENLVIDPERRIVNTERMTGAPFPANVNDLQFDEVDGVTLMTMLITYPTVEQRDMILATGMTDGMEASYARMERELLSAASA